MENEAAVNAGEPASGEVWQGKAGVPGQPPADSGENTLGAPDVPVTPSGVDPSIPGAPGIPGAEGEGVAVPAEGGPAHAPIWPADPALGPSVADVGVVEGAKDAVRAFARRLAGVENSEVTVPACAEISSQAVFAGGAQWVMRCDLTPGKLYFVTYDGAQMSYVVDAYVPVGVLCVPREHGYA